MPKTALQFRHNGREVAIFVDGGTNLLVALREQIGDLTPKFGCGQGGCGACSQDASDCSGNSTATFFDGQASSASAQTRPCSSWSS